MKEESRSKKSLIRELHALRKRLAELEGTAEQEHQQAEIALNDAELRYEKLTEASFDGIVVTEDGVIVEADDSAATILRRDPGNLVGLDGVATGETDKIFDKFYGSADEISRNMKGTGLGLYDTRRISRRTGERCGVRQNRVSGSGLSSLFQRKGLNRGSTRMPRDVAVVDIMTVPWNMCDRLAAALDTLGQ